MEWTVAELADRAGISGRTLRHYHAIGLLVPDRVGANGYRYYGPVSVARLQRILLLRATGMPLDDIARALADAASDAEIAALEEHLTALDAERATVERRIEAVRHTLEMRRAGREPRMDVMLRGFNDDYEDEVVRRWGRAAFEASHSWWHSKSVREQRAWKADAEALLSEWRRLQESGCAPNSPAAQAHAAVHLRWFAAIPGTPAHVGDRSRTAAMVRGTAAQYESNPDFHVAFGTQDAARFAAASLRVHLDETA